MSSCMSICVPPCLWRRCLAFRRALLRLLQRIHLLQGRYSSVEVNLFSSAVPSPTSRHSLQGQGQAHTRLSQTARQLGLHVGPNSSSVGERERVPPSSSQPGPESKPHRICGNGLGRKACLFMQQGHKGLNQDAMIVWEDFGSMEGTTFCGVFDGHGSDGHRVAQRVRDLLPLKLIQSWQLNQDELGGIAANRDFCREAENGDGGLDNVSLWKECFLNAHKLMDEELRVKSNMNCYCSGTTAVTLVKQGCDVIISNLGDSRAILGTISDTGAAMAVQLTVDLKPSRPEEAERIKKAKGRVFALRDEPEVQRVWLPHDRSPGLAMSRAFGDLCLKDFGLIAVPVVTHRQLTDRDMFIVLATDGVWDVLSNEQVVRVVCSVPAKAYAARAVVEYAARAWRHKYPTSKMDDCAVVCFYVNHRTPTIPDGSLQRTADKDEVNSSSNQEVEPKKDTVFIQ